jgi:hypothetical protein
LPFEAAAHFHFKPKVVTMCAEAMPMRSALITVCGLIALFTPLLLWTAWSQWMFWLIIATGCAALLIIYFLIWSSPDEFL